MKEGIFRKTNLVMGLALDIEIKKAVGIRKLTSTRPRANTTYTNQQNVFKNMRNCYITPEKLQRNINYSHGQEKKITDAKVKTEGK